MRTAIEINVMIKLRNLPELTASYCRWSWAFIKQHNQLQVAFLVRMCTPCKGLTCAERPVQAGQSAVVARGLCNASLSEGGAEGQASVTKFCRSHGLPALPALDAQRPVSYTHLTLPTNREV